MNARFQPEKSDGRSSDPRTLNSSTMSVCAVTDPRKQDVSTRTPDELEAAIRAAGAIVEKHVNAGHRQKAREAFDEVRRLVALRSAETVEEMEQSRDLQQLGRIEDQRENAYQESLREL